MNIHDNKDFETLINDHLVEHGGYLQGDTQGFDRKRALFPDEALAFIEHTQGELWKTLQEQHGEGFRTAVLDCLAENLDSRGTLDVLQHGFEFLGKRIEMASFKPASDPNMEGIDKYAHNRFTVTNQVRYSVHHEGSIDLVISLNGLPIATSEVKNPMTGQTAEHAIWQYADARNPKEPLFRYKRGALFHFALDTDEVFVTTELNGEKTCFAPFKRGKNVGVSNSDNPDGCRSAFLWEEAFERKRFLDRLAG